MQCINITCENNPVREGCSAGNIRLKTFKCKDRGANNSIYAVNAEQHIKQISSDGSESFLFKEDQKQNSNPAPQVNARAEALKHLLLIFLFFCI